MPVLSLHTSRLHLEYYELRETSMSMERCLYHFSRLPDQILIHWSIMQIICKQNVFGRSSPFSRWRNMHIALWSSMLDASTDATQKTRALSYSVFIKNKSSSCDIVLSNNWNPLSGIWQMSHRCKIAWHILHNGADKRLGSWSIEC